MASQFYAIHPQQYSLDLTIAILSTDMTSSAVCKNNLINNAEENVRCSDIDYGAELRSYCKLRFMIC